MSKRLFLIGALSFCLMATLGAGAEAARCRFISGVPYCSDFCVESCWSGLGNLDQNPVEVVISVGIKEAAVLCINNGGNSDTAQGNPFAVNLTPVEIGKAAVTGDDLVGRGKACIGEDEADPFCIAGNTIYDSIKDQIPEYPCQNRNWSVLPDAVITKALVYYQAFYAVTGERVYAASACQDCTRVIDPTTGDCSYYCTTETNSTCISAGLSCSNTSPDGSCF
jgi:hypothetical protein